MVLVVPVVAELAVVDGVEENDAADNHLEKRSNSGSAWLNVGVLPSPVSAANGSSKCAGALVAATEPLAQLRDLHLAEWCV